MLASLYIHIPVCATKCAYCDFFSVPLKGSGLSFPFGRFVAALLNEIRAKLALYGASGFSTVYVGGGTPSLIPIESVVFLCEEIAPRAAPSCEWTVEMNPCDVTKERLAAWNEGGASRLSLGIQSLSDRTLAAIKRRGTAAQNIAALSLASSEWRGDISLDFIAGLPFQTAASLSRDIKEILSFSPSHVSLYQLSLETKALLLALSESGAAPLPGDDEAAEIWDAGKDALEAAGLLRYEVSNFALEGHESRHNMAYWRLNSFIGAGPGASGTLVGDGACTRLENTQDMGKWLAFWEGEGRNEDFALDKSAIARAPMRVEQIGYKDFAFETLMMGMRLTRGISEEGFRARFPEGLDGLFGGALQKWERGGRLKREGGRLSLTEEGLLFLNAFLLECLEELSEKGPIR